MNAHEASPLVILGLILGLFAACGSDSTTTTNNNNSNDTSGCPNGTVTSADIQAAFKPVTIPACSGQMFAKYQDAGFQAVNKSIISIALNTNQVANIGSSFQDKLANANTTRQTEFTANLGTFLEAAYGNPNATYTGPSMETAHGDLKITIAQYNNFITDVVVPALKANVGADNQNDIGNCFAPPVVDPNFVAQFVTCK